VGVLVFWFAVQRDLKPREENSPVDCF
jgi:hypothetical protein